MNNQITPEGNELQDNTEGSSIEKSQSQRDWLKILEYAALGSSAVGSIIAWWLQQVLFAATPLTLTLGLNLLNRERLEQLLRQENNAAMMARTENSIGTLDSEIQGMATEPAGIEPAITDNISLLEATIKKLENNSISNEEIDKISERILLLEENLNDLQEAIKNESEGREKTVESKEIEEAKSENYASKSELSLDITALQAQLEKLQQQVEKLQKQNREIIKPYLQRLNRAIKQLQKK